MKEKRKYAVFAVILFFLYLLFRLCILNHLDIIIIFTAVKKYNTAFLKKKRHIVE